MAPRYYMNAPSVDDVRKAYQDYQQKAQEAAAQQQETATRQHQFAVDKLQTQLEQKDGELMALKEVHEKTKSTLQREQQLVASAFYQMGMELNRLNSQQRQQRRFV